MTCWYNEPKDGYAKIGALIDAAESNSRVDFSEGIFKLNPAEKAIDCYLFATNVTDIKKRDGNGWKFEPQAIFFQLRNDPYEKSQGQNKPPVKVEPTAFSKWLYRTLEQQIEFSDVGNDIFLAKGFIQFIEPTNSVTAQMILTGKDSKGKELSEDTINFFSEQCFTLEPIAAEDLQNLKLDNLPDLSPKGGSRAGGGYTRGQTELERLRDRLTFTKSVCGLQENATLEELAAYYAENDAVTALLQMLIK